MATIALVKLSTPTTISGNSPQLRYYPEANSQTFKSGEVVYLVSGKVTACASATPTQILGIAAEDANNNSASADIGVWVANADTLFEGNMSNGSQAGAASSTAYVGLRKALDYDSTNHKYYISTSGTSPRVTIIDNSPRDTVGDTGGRVLFQFMQIYNQLSSTS